MQRHLKKKMKSDFCDHLSLTHVKDLGFLLLLQRLRFQIKLQVRKFVQEFQDLKSKRLEENGETLAKERD